MLFYSNNIVGPYFPNDESIVIAYVFLILVCFGLYRFYKKLKLKKLSTDFNDTKLHSMDNYTFSFTTTEVAIASSAKKIGIVTKIVVWSLIAFFVVTPIYSMIPKLEPVYNFGYGFMNCFGF